MLQSNSFVHRVGIIWILTVTLLLNISIASTDDDVIECQGKVLLKSFLL